MCFFSCLICHSYVERGFGGRCLEKEKGGGGVGSLVSLGLLMIRRWMRWKICYCGKSVIVDVEDRVRWRESKDSMFLVKVLYKALEMESTTCFPMKIIWNSSVQLKVSFFAWESTWGKVLTLDQV